jgi:superfamily II DNA or RNA helicase
MSKIRLMLDKQITVIGAGPEIVSQLKKEFSFPNPKFEEARRHGRWTGKIDRILYFYEESQGSVKCPRGAIRQVLNIVGWDIDFQDNRRTLPKVDFQFKGVLRPYQKIAIAEMLKKDFGVLCAPCGAGKTVMLLSMIAQRKQPTLVLIHNKELLAQWADRIKSFLHITAGLIGDGKYDIQPITVGITNSVRKHLDELPKYFGQIISDEVHRCPSTMLSEVVQAFDSKYMIGCSGSPYRRDGLTKLIGWFAGMATYKIDPEELKDTGAVLVPEIIYKQTDFHYNFRDDYAKMLSVLTQDETRNTQIAQDILREAGGCRGTILVVSDRIKHCLALSDLLQGSGLDLNVKILTSQLKSQERTSLVEDIRNGKVDVVIATVQLVGEGLDIAGLSSLFLATPIKFSGRLIQVIGRILRPADGKKPRVYDYRDPVGPLFASARAREKTYKEMNWLK